MAANKAPTVKLTREQLYAMAAASTFGRGTEMVINMESYNPDNGSIIAAVLCRDAAPPQRKKDAHANGWIYYHINNKGWVKPLTEKELAE